MRGIPHPKKDKHANIRLENLISRVAKSQHAKQVFANFFHLVPSGRAMHRAFSRYKTPEQQEWLGTLFVRTLQEEDKSIAGIVAKAFRQHDVVHELKDKAGMPFVDRLWTVHYTAKYTKSPSAVSTVADTLSRVRDSSLENVRWSIERVAEVTGDASLVKKVASIATKYEGLPLTFAMYCIYGAVDRVQQGHKDKEYLRNVMNSLDNSAVQWFANTYKRKNRRELMHAVWETALHTANPHATFSVVGGATWHKGEPLRAYLKGIAGIAEYTKSPAAIYAARHLASHYQHHRKSVLPMIMDSLGTLAMRTKSSNAVVRAAEMLTSNTVLDVVDGYHGDARESVMNKIIKQACTSRSRKAVEETAQKYRDRIAYKMII